MQRVRSSRGDADLRGQVPIGTSVGDQIARIDRGGGSVTDSAIDAMGSRLTVGATWVVPNVRGDVAALLVSAQTSIGDAYRYDPYGVVLASIGSSTNPYRFQGRLLESTSGQYDFGARQYDPALASFTSLDTVLGRAANPISLNRYLYAHANPESMIDPDGHAACRYADDCEEVGAATARAHQTKAVATSKRREANRLYRAALAAETEADIAQAAAEQPCPLARLGESELCSGWAGPRASQAAKARGRADTAWHVWRAAERSARAAESAAEAAESQLRQTKARATVAVGFAASKKPTWTPAQAEAAKRRDWVRHEQASLKRVTKAHQGSRIVAQRALRDMKGELVRIGKNYVVPDAQVIDRTTNKVLKTVEAGTGSPDYYQRKLKEMARKQAFNNELANPRFGSSAYKQSEIPPVELDWQPRSPSVGRIANTGLGALSIVSVIIGVFADQADRDRYERWSRDHPNEARRAYCMAVFKNPACSA